MTLQRMGHAGAAPATTLSSGISSSATTFNIVSGTGWPSGSNPFIMKIDAGTTSEEKLLVTLSGTTVTVSVGGRGYDNTVASAHSVVTNAVEHDCAAVEIDDANDHIYTTTRDDHTQYARTDGTRAITGAQSFSSSVTVTGSLTVGGITTGQLGGSTDPGWTAVSPFSNSWANVGGADMVAGYRKVNGRVYLRGIITKGSWSGVAFTLPAGYRPSATISPGTITTGGNAAYILVDSSGNVTPSNAASGAVDLGVVSFDTL